MEEALTYDDVLLVPQRSDVESRDDVSLASDVTPNIQIDTPLLSAPMDSVTEVDMANAMVREGGMGVIHRFCDVDEQAEMVKEAGGAVGASVGIDGPWLERADECIISGASFICVDVAHAHMAKCLEVVEELSNSIEVDIMVGNIATGQAARELVSAGADAVKVGVGPGSHCTTRKKTGVGVTQFTAVKEVSDTMPWEDITIVADGGIRKPGDAVKALMAGADTVMMGATFGRCEESPEGGDVWGMASGKGKEKIGSEGFIEGETSESNGEQNVSEIVEEYCDGLRSGLSYCGGHTIDEARDNAQFVRTTPSETQRSGAFINPEQ